MRDFRNAWKCGRCGYLMAADYILDRENPYRCIGCNKVHHDWHQQTDEHLVKHVTISLHRNEDKLSLMQWSYDFPEPLVLKNGETLTAHVDTVDESGEIWHYHYGARS